MEENRVIPLGSRAIDIITGFDGIVIGRAIYLTGCDQYLLNPKCKEGNSRVDGLWIDEQRLQVQDDIPIQLDNSRSRGCDISAPIK